MTRLAFHGQVLVMAATFGLHPDVVDWLKVGRRRLRKLHDRLWSRARAKGPGPLALGPGGQGGVGTGPPTPLPPHKLSVFGRQYSLAKARFE